MSDETRARFLAAIAERVNPDHVEEIHLFQPLKQGGIESGVAVVAVNEHPRAAVPHDSAAAETHVAEAVSEAASYGAEAALEEGIMAPDAGAGAVAPEADVVQMSEDRSSRLAVHTAKYRLTLKGPERGKWEFAMQAEADAPLVTVDKVVRGVQRRSGDAEEAQRLTGDEFRSLLPPREAGEERAS